MQIIELLQELPLLFTALAALLGLVIGSFLNVVIHRLPRMMEREWREQCRELTGEDGAADAPARYDLLSPGSHCPQCNHRIGARENIPLLSYLLQKGQCRHCGAAIPARYPIVELLTGVLSAVVAAHFGFGWPALLALLLTWALVALTFIDLDTQLLPDGITQPFLWLGLLAALYGVYTDLETAVIGAVAGYLSLWLVFHLFKLLTGKEGMGYGDFKLFALFGAWLGWQALPLIILLSSLVGAVVGIALIALRGHDRSVPIPFGPYLAAAGWIALLWGDAITGAYLGWIAGL